MIVTIKAEVRKRCPYKPEIDYGTATLTFQLISDDAPELHDLAKQLNATGDEEVSHEDYTRLLFRTWQHAGLLHVQTTWRTAGLEVTCEVPDRRE